MLYRIQIRKFCAITLYVLQGMGELYPGAASISIFEIGIIQISSVVFVLCMLLVLKKSYTMLSMNWLQSESMQKANLILSSYHMVMNYDEACEEKKSIIWSQCHLVKPNFVKLRD